MKPKKLKPEALYRQCEIKDCPFETTADLDILQEVIGQPRAIEAIRLGIEIKGQGYNIFAIGSPGTGKRTLIRQFLDRRAPLDPAPRDWCYVNNFESSDKPVALSLPSGKAPEFSYDMDQLLEDVRVVLPKAFESDEYSNRRETLQEKTFEEQERRIQEIADDAELKNINVVWTPGGVVFNPLKDGEPMTPEQVEALSDDDRKTFEEKAEKIQEAILEIMQDVPRLHRRARQAIEELDRETALKAFAPLIDELKRKYSESSKVVNHLDSVQRHLTKHALTLIELQQPGDVEVSMDESPRWSLESEFLREYRTNVMVTHDSSQGAPVVYEENPTYDNMLGRVEYLSRMGTLITDFNLIKPGSLHRANGGYLIIDAHRLLSNPFVWDGLKRALNASEIKIESAASVLGLSSTVSLEPEPVPLDVKVILLGSRLLYYLLQSYDPDFQDLMRVSADFSEDMPWDETEEALYARLIATLIDRHELQPFDRSAVSRMIEHSARMAGDTQKLSIRIRALNGILREASYWSSRAGRTIVTAEDVEQTISAETLRLNQAQERGREAIQRGIHLIDTKGSQIGQVNGLSVFQFGELLFGSPMRITASTRMGDGDVVDIEREIELGGPSHSKGVMILQGFITQRYARKRPFSLSASLVFEQTYGSVEGDSASCAELFSLLSSIAEIPLKQSFAVTGSMNQHGEVQAIGAVNEKIEAFFDVCCERGLDGSHGVLIPASNVQHLMLRRDVVEAVTSGNFHIYPLDHVDQGIEILTDLPAGDVDAEGNFPEDSFNGTVSRILMETAELKRKFSSKKGR